MSNRTFLESKDLEYMKFQVASASIGTPAAEALLATYAKDFLPKLFTEVEELRRLADALHGQVHLLKSQNDKMSKELLNLESEKKAEPEW